MREELETLILSVEKMVWHLVRQQIPQDILDREDMAQELLLHLCIVAETWDDSRGTKFSTWARTVIGRRLSTLKATAKVRTRCRVDVEIPFDEMDIPSPKAYPPRLDLSPGLLSAREERLIRGTCEADETLTSMAKDLGISLSFACRIRGQAIEKLRRSGQYGQTSIPDGEILPELSPAR